MQYGFETAHAYFLQKVPPGTGTEKSARLGVGCPGACKKNVELEHKGKFLRLLGKLTLSGQDLCMIGHLPYLVNKGFRAFRINGMDETPKYLSLAGEIYKDALTKKALQSRLTGSPAFPTAGFATASTLASPALDTWEARKMGKTKKNTSKLLAPTGTLEAVKGAFGAGAVFIGALGLSRRMANEFTHDDIKSGTHRKTSRRIAETAGIIIRRFQAQTINRGADTKKA